MILFWFIFVMLCCWPRCLSVAPSVCWLELQRADRGDPARDASSEASGAGPHGQSSPQPGPQEPGAPQVRAWQIPQQWYRLVDLWKQLANLSFWSFLTPLCSNIRCFRVDPSPSAPCVNESHGAPAVWSHGYTEASGVKNKSVPPPPLFLCPSIYLRAFIFSLELMCFIDLYKSIRTQLSEWVNLF